MTGRLTCDVCGIGFHGRSDAIYCSSACRQKAHRDRAARGIARLAEQRRPGSGARQSAKPDVAATIQRARREQSRARELCRTAADTLQKSLASQRLLMSQRAARAQTSRPPWSGGAAVRASVAERA